MAVATIPKGVDNFALFSIYSTVLDSLLSLKIAKGLSRLLVHGTRCLIAKPNQKNRQLDRSLLL